MNAPYKRLLTIDAETRWSSKETSSFGKYTLSSSTTEEYIRDPRFKAFGVCIHEFGTDKKTLWYSHKELPNIFSTYDWSETAVLCQNSMFDCGILSFIYDVHPCFIFDTLSMARAVRGTAEGNSLAKMAEAYGLPPKGRAVHSTDGLEELTPVIEKELADYCVHDVFLCEEIFKRLVVGFPSKELRLIDMTIKMFTEPRLVLDTALLEIAEESELDNLKQALAKAGVDEAELASNEMFADILRSYGIEPPMKISKQTGKPALALAKNDAHFQQLLNGDNEEVALLCDARVNVKSTQARTRARRFLGIASRGALPIPLNYFATETGRYGGTQQVNMQNMKRGGFLRKSIMAPDGYVVGVGDLSQIECVSGDTKVLTKLRGYIKIVDISKHDLLWDGVEWVTHGGVVNKGNKEVISYGGITGTANHIVFTSDGRKLSLFDAKAEMAALAIGEREGKAVRFMGGATNSNTFDKTGAGMVSVWALWAGAFGGVRRFAKRGIKGVQWIFPHQSVLQNFTKERSENAMFSVQPDNLSYKPKGNKSSLSKLSNTWYKKPIQFVRGLCSVYLGKLSDAGLWECGDRQSRQQWALCAGEYTASYTGRKCTEPGVQLENSIQRNNHERTKILAGSKAGLPLQHSKLLLETGGVPSKHLVPVFDIINAGPRNRFTANGVIISNCRTLAWLADDDNMLNIFNSGGDPYALFGEGMFGIPGLNKDDHPIERQASKATLLGAQYQLGAVAFSAQLLVGFLGAKPLRYNKEQAKQLGVTRAHVEQFQNNEELMSRVQAIPHTCTSVELMIHFLAAKAIIDKYRATAVPVVNFWNFAGERIQESLLGGEEHNHKGVLLFRKNEIVMVSGLSLKYHNLRQEDEVNALGKKTGRKQYVYDIGPKKEKLYPGRVVNNLNQGTARIVMTDAMLRVQKRYPVVGSVHDEILVLIPEQEAEEGLAWVLAQMTMEPKWLPGIPLSADGGYAKRYGEAKK